MSTPETQRSFELMKRGMELVQETMQLLDILGTVPVCADSQAAVQAMARKLAAAESEATAACPHNGFAVTSIRFAKDLLGPFN